MQAPDPSAALLDLWERTWGLPLQQRALELVCAANPQLAATHCAHWPVGKRDRALLVLRERLFGSQLHSTSQCPECGETAELEFQCGDILTPEPEPTAPSEILCREPPFELQFRLPNSLDLISLNHGAPPSQNRLALLRRCLIKAKSGRKTVAAEALPEKVIKKLTAQMAKADPQADVQLALQCPACQHNWQAPFDIAAYLWAEIDVWAQRLLGDIHLLARAYGWTEHEVLKLSPARRKIYMGMVRG